VCARLFTGGMVDVMGRSGRGCRGNGSAVVVAFGEVASMRVDCKSGEL